MYERYVAANEWFNNFAGTDRSPIEAMREEVPKQGG